MNVNENEQTINKKEINKNSQLTVYPINIEEENSVEKFESNRITKYEKKNENSSHLKNEEPNINKDLKPSMKDTIENKNNLNDKFQEKYIKKIFDKYHIVENDNNKNEINLYNNLIKSYFDNKLIDENYVNNFTNKDDNKIKKSIMFKKYIIKEEDNSNQFKQIFNHMFCSFKLFKLILKCCKCIKRGKDSNDINSKEEKSKYLKYQNFWTFGLNLILFEVTGFFLLSQIIIILFLSKYRNSQNYDNKNESNLRENFYSNEYKCLQLEIDDLFNDNYSFNITCNNNSIFFYITKFGVSPFSEEGENIAGCFSTSFKNLINIDSDCDLTSYLEEKLKEYKYQETNILVNTKEMNLSNEIKNNCNNKNQRTKFFLSYSCYIPFIKTNENNEDKKKRNELIHPIILFESILFFLNYLSLFYHSYKFSQAMKLNSIKNRTLMINTLDIEREKIPKFLNELLISTKNKLLELNILQQDDNYYSIIKEINYSFMNSDEKELYDKFNYLLRKKEYLNEKINSQEKDKEIPKNLIFTLLSKICKCFKTTYQQEYNNMEKELNEIFTKIIEQRPKDYHIKKIYITFSKYEIKSILKNKKILIGNDYHTLKKSDMSPQDINWENLNIGMTNRLKRRIISYLLIIILLSAYFLLVIIISSAQNTFQRKYNLLTDCSNIDYENNYGLIYNEYNNTNQNEKEKIYTYCFCKNNIKREKISYNDIIFDPCIDYNKYKFQRKAYIYLLSIILSIINLFVDIIVNKIISIQKFESKSNQKNLNIVITIFILIFTNIVSVILINSKITNKKISKYFGQYEDITPQWINEMSENIITNLYMKIGVNIGLNLIYILLFTPTGFCYNKKIYYYFIYLIENPIIHFYEYFKIYAPEKDYIKYSTNTIFFLFNVSILIFSPNNNFIASICLMVQAILFMFHNSFINSFSYFLNKHYFKIIIMFINIFLIFHTLLEIWWFSSEYFFIDISENLYDEFFGSNKVLIDKFIKGNATISEKIKIKCLLKRNIWFFLQLIAIIIMEVIKLVYCQNKKTINNEKQNENLLQLDDYSKIKYYELYRLISYKLNDLHINNVESVKEYFNYLQYKYNEYKNEIIKNEESNENYDDTIMLEKNKMIEENKIVFNNPDYTYSPFLLDGYNISFISKFILTPGYS